MPGSPCGLCITTSKQGCCYLLPEARQATGFITADVQRLHMIRALAKAGLELAEIRDFLEQRSLTLAELLDGQITLLDKQLRSIHTLRNRLVELRTGLTDDATPDLESTATDSGVNEYVRSLV